MNFFDREEDCGKVWDLFDKDKDVLMLAPRRIGKTCLLHQLRGQGADKGYSAIVFDMEGYTEEKDFFQQLCSAIQEEIGSGGTLLSTFTQRFKQIIKGPDTDGDWRQLLFHTDWRQFAETLLSTLNEPENGKQWLIMVDEIPIFIHALLKSDDRNRASGFLYWLRNMRQRYRNVRWLYTGSIGLDSVSRREEMEGALLDLEVFSLKPFTSKTAEAFLESLAEKDSCSFSKGVIPHILEGLGWLSPYYLEKIFMEACARKDGKGIVSQQVAQEALDAMLQLDKRLYWASWREHLTKNFSDPERSHLFRILEVIAADIHGASRDTLLLALNRGDVQINDKQLTNLIDTLEGDGYIIACDENRTRYRFVMNLLRQWWLRYVVAAA